MSQNQHASEAGARPLPFDAPIGCPICRAAPLRVAGERILCPPCDRADCPREFRMAGAFPDLIVGGRFEDETDEDFIRNEERNTEHTVRRYWTPMFRRLAADLDRPARILALGCGSGLEVDLLRREGFNCVGVDNGERARSWARRESRCALAMANGMHLPFPDATFDIAFCGCVFPHVGVIGDSNKVSERFHEDRLAMAREMARVVRPGGNVIVSSPNRLFPLDLFHGRDIGSYRTPINPPWRRFLLSAGDYRRLFREAGCRGPARAESIRDYWGFHRSRSEWKGRLLSLPVRALFYLGSNGATPFLRASPLLPWIVVRVTR